MKPPSPWYIITALPVSFLIFSAYKDKNGYHGEVETKCKRLARGSRPGILRSPSLPHEIFKRDNPLTVEMNSGLDSEE